jgi:uncharacterized protein YdhG (YjbR/CyaY superfamily)
MRKLNNIAMKTYETVGEYMKSVPKEFLAHTKQMRSLVKKLIPNGVESINYGMPTVLLNGKNLIHFAAMKGHLGFYPAPSGVAAFASELSKKGIDFSKGCIRFSYKKPLPIVLISNIIKFRVKEQI